MDQQRRARIQAHEEASNGSSDRFEEKRRIVEATLAPDRSVTEVAQAHGVRANQVFKWRRL